MIKRTSYFGVVRTITPALILEGVQMTAPALLLTHTNKKKKF